MKNFTKNIVTIFLISFLCYLPNAIFAQCPVGQTYNTYCYGQNLTNEVAFEFCPTAGSIAQSNIIAGAIGGIAPINTLTVYEGAAGSGVGGTIVFGPASSADFSGTTITSSATNLCLIFVINSLPVSITCQDGFDTPPLEVCSENLAGTTVSFTAPADLCITAGVQAGLSGGSPAGGVYSGPGVTDDGNGMTYSLNLAVAGVGTHTITYTNVGIATDDVEVFALPLVNFTALADLCIDAGIQTGLGGGVPFGGVYAGPGVTDNGNGTYDFNPAAAGLGVHNITYTEPGVCMVSSTDMVEVLAACGCPAAQTSYFHCTTPPEVNLVIFEVCPSAGSAAQATITQGSFDANFGNNLSVYEGAAGSGMTGVLVTGPLTGDLTGTTIMGNGADNCLIFISNAPALGCSTGTDVSLQVCGEDITPSISFTALADLCIDAGVQAGLSGGLPTGGVYSGPGVTDDGNGMTYSFDPAAAGVGTHTLTYTAAGNSATDDVEVFALGTAGCLSFTALADLCIDAGVQAGLSGGSPTGGIYSGSGVTDDANGMTYSFDPAAAGIGTHSITYTQGGNAASDDVEVFALPTVTLNITTNNTLCVDAPVTLYTLTALPSGGTFSGTGVANIADGISFTFNPAAAGIGTHTVTYNVTDGNGCSGMATDEIEVIGPAITFTALADLCINAGVQTGLGGGMPTGGTYSGPGVTDNGNGMTYSFDPAAAGVGTHTIAYSATDGNGCTGMATDDVEVFALPNTMFTAPADLCVDAGVQAGLGGGSPTGGIYSGPGVTDDGNGMTYSFDPAMAEAGTHTITYTVGVAGCSGSATDDVEVFALPTVTFTIPANQDEFCVDDQITVIIGAGDPIGGVYSGPGVIDGGSGITFIFDPSSAGVGTHTVTYTLTDANGCSASATDDIVVNPLPVVAFTALADLCIDAGVQAGLGGGTPPQGTAIGDMGVYSGTGVTDDGNGMTYSFDPAAAGVGVHTLTYTYTDANGCTNSASDDVEVFALPTVTFTAPAPDVCIEDATITGLGGGMPMGGVYSGTGVADDGNGMTFSFDPTAAAPNGGNIPVTYTFTDANGCTASATDDIFVNPICCVPPTITCPANNFGLPTGCNPTVPAGTTSFNVAGGTTPDPALPTIMDGCEPLVLTFTDATTDVGCMRTVTRTYRITDDNGDFAECDQLFTFTVDTDPPVLSAMPPSTTVECDAIPPVPNITATDNCPSIAPVLFINELHYDNAGGDVGEFLEIAGTAGIDLSLYEVFAYEAFDGQFDAQVQLSGIIPNEAAGFGAVAFTRTELPTGFFENGTSDAIALVEIVTGDVIQFISYEGTTTATNGPAAGMTSTDIGVSEPSNTPVGQSLQLIGIDGCPSSDFTWTGPATASPGFINTGQTFDINACPQVNELPVVFMENITTGTCPQEQTITRTWSAMDNCGNPVNYTQTITVEDNTIPEFCNVPMNITVDCGEVPAAEVVSATDNCDFSGMSNIVWINEFHYDNAGGDTGEFIEIAGVAGTAMSGYQLVTYNGANGLVDDTYNLHGMIDNESCNRGALSFPTPGLQNGSPDGFALVAPDGTVLELLSYEGSFTANNGPANGMTSTNVGVSEPGSTPVGFSLQLTGTGASGPDFVWTAPAAASPGDLNTNQEVTGNLIGILTEVDNTTKCDGGTITRTWNTQDACGNMATPAVQIITVNPALAPTLTPPTFPTLISCEEGAAFVAPPATFTNDLLGACNISGAIDPIVVPNFDACGGTITVTYDDVDECGNPLVAGPFVINVEAAPLPVISIPAYSSPMSCETAASFVPSDATYSNGLTGICNISGIIPAAFDNNFDACGGNITVYYFGVDDCGRAISVPPIVLAVQPAPMPTITLPTLPTSVSCADAASYVPPTATYDNGLSGVCNLSGNANHTINYDYDGCGGVLQVIYLAQDPCGRNLVKTSALITVDPAPAPTINVPSYPSELSCYEAEALVGIVATYSNGLDDDCLIEGFLAPSIAKNVDACNGGNVIITYSGMDDCGNFISAPSIVIPVSPASLPTVQLSDDPLSISCSEANNFSPSPATFSNGENGFCENSGELTLTTLENYWDECDGGYILLQFSGEDNCGNALQTDLYKIAVNPDLAAPQGECVPVVETIEDIKNTPTPADLDFYKYMIAMNYYESCGEVFVTIISDSGTPVCGLDGTFSRVYEVEITDHCGNVAGNCSITFEGNCNPLYCTLSEDFYSTPDEQFGGFTSLGMINELIDFGANPITVGTGDCGFTLDNADCIQAALTGDGQSISLPAGFDLGCGSTTNNNLVDQIITTTLNIRYNAQLNGSGLDYGNFQLDAACMYIPLSVANGLPDNATINDLIDFANNFIGCQCSNTCDQYEDVMDELTGILLGLNSRFNKCHVPGPCFLANETETTEPEENPGTLFPTIGETNAEIGNSLDVKIFPNPASKFLFVKMKEAQGEAVTIEIFDIQGRKIKAKTYTSFDQNQLQLDVQKYPEGMYWITIKVDGFNQVVKKFVLNN